MSNMTSQRQQLQLQQEHLIEKALKKACRNQKIHLKLINSEYEKKHQN